MSDLPPTDLSAKADLLIEQVEELAQSMRESNTAFAMWNADLTNYSRHSRNMVRGLIVAFIVEILLLTAVIYAVHETRQSLDQVKEVAAEACADSNVVRSKQVGLWEEVFRLSARPDADPAQAQRIIDFRAFLNDTFKQRDCTT